MEQKRIATPAFGRFAMTDHCHSGRSEESIFPPFRFLKKPEGEPEIGLYINISLYKRTDCRSFPVVLRSEATKNP